MRKVAFTLLELLLVVAILATLATIVIPNLQNAVEDSKGKVCSTNLRVQQAALDIYAMEHDSMPATLSSIPREYRERAFAQIMRQKGAWKIKLAYWLIDLSEGSFAHASFMKDDIAKGQRSFLICPKDHNPDEHGGMSYGLNIILEGMNSRQYRDLPGTTLLIADCNNSTFSGVDELEGRHVHHKILSRQAFAQGVTKGKKITRYGRGAKEENGDNAEALEKCISECAEEFARCLQSPGSHPAECANVKTKCIDDCSTD